MKLVSRDQKGWWFEASRLPREIVESVRVGEYPVSEDVTFWFLVHGDSMYMLEEGEDALLELLREEDGWKAWMLLFPGKGNDYYKAISNPVIFPPGEHPHLWIEVPLPISRRQLRWTFKVPVTEPGRRFAEES